MGRMEEDEFDIQGGKEEDLIVAAKEIVERALGIIWTCILTCVNIVAHLLAYLSCLQTETLT
jgi:hypothetical protein